MAAIRFRRCTPVQQRKLERCIQSVKGRPGIGSAHAVCQASLRCSRRPK